MSNKASIRALLILFALVLPASAQPQLLIGKVVSVSDGDTITILDKQKRQYKIRLEGIDAPEINQDYGSRAKRSLSDLVLGKTVTVRFYGKDPDRQMISGVHRLHDTMDICQEQINRGMAWFYREYATNLPVNTAAKYEQAETLARQETRGLWADSSPIPPWDFRRGETAKDPGVKPATTAGGQIIGNRNIKIYHLPNCPDYSKVSEKNRVPFANEADAVKAGYRKAKTCPQ
jgi:endonuclease YncB( thermonuclease family)